MSNENKQPDERAAFIEAVKTTKPYNDVQAGEVWDNGWYGKGIWDAAIAYARANQQATKGDDRANFDGMTGIDAAKRLIVRRVREAVGNDTFSAYIREVLAGDFAVEVAKLVQGSQFECAARKQGTAGGNDPADCDWPHCGCDEHANRVIEAIPEPTPTTPHPVAGSAGQAQVAKVAVSHHQNGGFEFEPTQHGIDTLRNGSHALYLAPTAPSLTTDAGAVTDLAQRCRELIELAEIGESKQEALRALADTYHPDITPHDRRAMAISQTHLEAVRALLAAHPEQRMSDAAICPAKSHCQNGGDVCLAGNRDGVCCPEDSCDIDDGTRKNPIDAVRDAVLTDLQRDTIHWAIEVARDAGAKVRERVLRGLLAARKSEIERSGGDA